MKYKLSLLFLSAFLIRLIALDQSVWLDEAITAQVVKTYNFFSIISVFSPLDFHPPLYYLVLKVWTTVFGYSSIVLRMPSVLFSLATGWFVYQLGKLLQDEKTGFWSAVFFLFNPLIIYYAQEARMYMMVTFLLTAGFYYVQKAIQQSDTYSQHNYVAIILVNLFIFLSFLTHYASVFFIAAMYFYLLLQKRWKLLFLTMPGFIASLVVGGQLLYHQLVYSKEALKQVKHWDLVLGKVTLKNLFLIPLKFTSGRISFYPKIVYYVIAGSWMMVSMAIMLYGGLKKKFLLLLFIFPLVFAAIFSFVSPLLQYFRFLYLIPIMSLLIVFGLNKIKIARVYPVIAGIFIIFSGVYVFTPSFHRENWKGLSQAIILRNLTDNKQYVPVYMIPSASDPLTYYLPTLKISDISTLGTTPFLPNEIAVIPYVSDIHGVDYKTELLKKGYVETEKESFNGLVLEHWTKN